MTSYYADAPPLDARRYYREERHVERRDPRHEDNHYLRTNQVTTRNELVPRQRQESELSIEEVRRDFPPPGHSNRDLRRARSADPGQYYDGLYDPRHDHDNRSMREGNHGHRHQKKPGSVFYEEEERVRKKGISKQEKIVAAVVGGVIAAGAKEAWDRREAQQDGIDVDRNLVTSAALGAAGAFAGYQGAEIYNKRKTKEDKKSTYIVHKGRDGRISEYYSDDEDDPRGRKGHKNFLENALSAAGLGGAIKALTGGDDKSRHDSGRSRSRRASVDSRRSEGDMAKKIQKAAKASLVAGAAEAFRIHKEPGGWQGEKLSRVLTTAMGAGAINAAKDPRRERKRDLAQSVIGGLIGNRMLNGSRKEIEEDSDTGRSRSRSRTHSRTRSRSRARSEGGGGSGAAGGLAALTAGLGALAGKKMMDKKRDESRGRGRSADSYDSRYDGRSKNGRSRSRSVIDGARRSLAKIGLGNGPSDEEDDYEYSRSPPRRDRDRRRNKSRDSRYDDDHHSRNYMSGGRGDYDDDRSVRSRNRSRSRSRGGRSLSPTSSDLGDSEEDERRARKMRGKQLITTGLASVATIHAAHNVYNSVEKRNARHKAVKAGKLSDAEAKKLKSKAMLQDAASVAVAAFGIKGALSEMKEAKEMADEVKQFKEERKLRHQRRLQRTQQGHDGQDRRYSRSRADSWSSSSSAPPRTGRNDDGVHYSDGNPYSATLPAPPIGYEIM